MSFWLFKNAAASDEAELQVYGDIGEWSDVDSREFTNQLKKITAKRISVRINSGGGSVFTAQAILSSLRRHKADVYVYIDGLAASAASVIAMAGDFIVMPSNSMMMIHNPATISWGEAKDMRKIADTLDKVRDTIVAAYKDRTGLDEQKIIELMDEETWMTAAEAVELGFADEIEDYQNIAASVQSGTMFVNGIQVDASRYKHIPEAWAKAEPEITDSHDQPGKTAGETEETETEPMNLEELKAKHPDLYKQIVDDAEKAGVEKERARIKDIEDMAMPGHDEMVNKAKFDSGITAEQLAVDIVKAEKQRGKDYLNNRDQDGDLDVDATVDDGNPPDASASADDAKRDSWRAAAKSVTARKKPSIFRNKGE